MTKPNAVDAILATNPRYAGATQGDWPAYCGTVFGAPDTHLLEDAKLNAAKAIVAEQLFQLLENARKRIENLSAMCSERDWKSDQEVYLPRIDTALTAWREINQ